MKKRLLSVFLSLCMMLTMVPAAFAAELPETGAPAAQTQEEPQEQPQEQPQGNIQGDENQPSADVQEEENAVGEESTGESTEETDSQTPAGTQDDPFTTVAQYNAAVANNAKDGQDVYLTVEGQAFTTENTFALTNVQSRLNPPKLHLTIKNCTFTGNTANDSSNSSFMYLPNCQSLVLENCTFNSGNDALKYGINWNLCGITDSTVKISGCTFDGSYSKNALKLNQRNGSDDKATDVKPSSGTATAATIQSAIIEDCTFASGAKVQLGSQGKGENGAAASSTGAFPVTIQNCKSSVVVELAYKEAANSATIETVTLETGKTLTKAANADPVVSEPVAKIGNVEYTTLQAAIAAAQQNNGTVTMLKDVALSATQEITGALTIDLNGHKISNGSIANNGYMLKINHGAKLNLVGDVANSAVADSRSNTTGTITAICVLGELNVKGDNLTISRSNGIAIKVDESGVGKQGKLTVESGTISSADQAVQNWGISTISGGTFNGDVDSAAYSNIGGQLTITGGSFTDDVYTWQMKYPNVWPSAASKINISGGTFNGNIAELYGDATTSLQPVTNVDFPEDGSCPEGVVSISGGTFSRNVSDFVAPGYQCTGSESQWTISAANNMGADVNVSGGDSNKTASATIGGNYAGDEGSSGGETGSTGGSVTAGPTVEINVQTGTASGGESGPAANTNVSKTEITVDSAALNSIKNNNSVQAVEIATDVGTLTIDKAAWSSMTDAATSGDRTASLVLTLEDKSTDSSNGNKTYEVKATVAGSENTNAFDEDSKGSVTIAVPYTLSESNSGVNVYWTDNGKMVDMNATLEEGVLSWETSHFSTYQAVAYSGSDEAQYMSNGNATSGTLSNAISAGGPITLLKDVTVSSSTLDITKDVTLDLNGHTITGSQVRVFWVKSGTLTLTGEGTVTTSGENTESFTSASSVIRVGNNSNTTTPETEAKLYVGADVTIEAPATYGVSVFGSGTEETVEISGKIHATGKAAALSGNGMAQYGGTTITIKPGAEITATQDAAIYHPQNGTLNIEGGTISGLTGIELKAGTVSVTGDAVIEGNGSLEHDSSGNGTSTKGYGIAIVENDAYAGTPTVTLSNGSVEGDVAVLSDTGYNGGSNDKNGKVEIKGGAVVNGNVTNNGFGESNITGGTVKGDVTQSGSGKTTISGAAVVEGNVNTTSGQTTISGGKVTGNVTGSKENTSITGGDFGGDVPSGSVSGEKVVVTFDPNGGTCTEKTRVLAANSQIGTLPTTTRSGYQFNGWYNGNTKVEATTTFNANATLVANWSYSGGGGGSSGGGGGGSSSASYAITVDKATGGTVKVSPTRADKGDTVTITVNPNSGYELDTLTVTDKDGGRISVNNAGNNKYTFTMPSGKVTVKATFAKVSEQPQPGISFSDVSASAYYYDAVKWAVENDVTSGTSATTFSPDASCTRAQMVTFLWRANGSPRTASANPFTDVQAGAYYYDAVLWAVEKGITSGTSATTFSPDMTVTRGQTVTFLHRANGSPAASGSNPFTDVAADAYYTAAVQWAVAEGVTSGTGANTFSPDAPCTRAQIVTFLYRDMA